MAHAQELFGGGKRMNRKIASRLAGIGLALTVGGGAVLANHSWNNYHWARTSNPLRVPIVDSVTSNWQTIYTTAVNDWDKSTVLDLSVRQQGDEGSQSRRKCAP